MATSRSRAPVEPAAPLNQCHRMKRPYDETIQLGEPHGKLCRRTLIVPVEVPVMDFRCFCCFQLASHFLSCGCFICRKCYQTKCSTKKVMSQAVSGCSCPSCGNQAVKSIDLDQLDDPNLKAARGVIDKMLDWPSVIYSLSVKYSGQKVYNLQYQDRLIKVALRKLAGAHKALQAMGTRSQAAGAAQGPQLCPTITSQQRQRLQAPHSDQQQNHSLLSRMKNARPSPSASHLISLSASRERHQPHHQHHPQHSGSAEGSLRQLHRRSDNNMMMMQQQQRQLSNGY